MLEITDLTLSLSQIESLVFDGYIYLKGKFYEGLRYQVYADDGNNRIIYHRSFVHDLVLARGLADACASEHPGARVWVSQGEEEVYSP